MDEKVFAIGDKVRVTDAEQQHMRRDELHTEDIPQLEQAAWTGIIGSYKEYPHANDYRVDFAPGMRLWFNAEMLTLADQALQAATHQEE